MAGGGIFYTTQLNNNPLLRKSQFSIAGAYTERKQWIVTHSGILSVTNDKHIIQWNLGWRNFFDRYYGLGISIDPTTYLPYRFETVNLHATLLTRMGKSPHFVGPVLRYNSMSKVIWEKEPEYFQWKSPPGYTGHATLGFGSRWVHDTRNQLVNPRKGHWYEFAFRIHPPMPDNNPSYHQWNLDVRHYLPLRQKQNPKGPLDEMIWASRIFVHSAGQGVSFREMPALGGDNLLRGYFRGYVRSYNLWAVENEVRGMWGKQLGWNLYAGTGQADKAWQSTLNRTPMASWGCGIRLIPNPNSGTLLRIDYARTADGQAGLYFEVNEAF
jgi:hypothetical protein